MENTTSKTIEFSILAIVKRSNSATRRMAYLEMMRKPDFYDLSELDFSEKWNTLINNKCLIYIEETEPEKGVKINPDKNCLIIYGLLELQSEKNKRLLK